MFDETRRLFLEQIFEGLAGVKRARRHSFRNRGCLCGLLIGSWSGVLLHGHAKFIELAAVLAILGSDAFGNGLHAFKLGAGIEEATLLAAVQFGITFGAGAIGIETGGENRSAIGATGAGDGTYHARCAGAEMIVLPAWAAGGRLLFRT